MEFYHQWGSGQGYVDRPIPCSRGNLYLTIVLHRYLSYLYLSLLNYFKASISPCSLKTVDNISLHACKLNLFIKKLYKERKGVIKNNLLKMNRLVDKTYAYQICDTLLYSKRPILKNNSFYNFIWVQWQELSLFCVEELNIFL